MSEAVREISYLSKIDNTMQPAMFSPASGDEPRPLIVALHTWSFDHKQDSDNYFSRSMKRNWHCIFPKFRGPNWLPEACGSDFVVSDIESAVDYVKANYPVDESRIYLAGGSGGGHASLLLAARRPELWTAVSSWCPISDLVKWHNFSFHAGAAGYAKDIREACSGNPEESVEAFNEAKRRSPVTYLASAAGKVVVDVGTGIHDGHTGSVPVAHTLEAFNLLAAPEDRISPEDIVYMVKEEAVPEHLKFEGVDPGYGENKVLFRRKSGIVRVTIFEGGHDLLPGPAFGFLEQQVRGSEPVWNSGNGEDSTAGELGK